MSAPSPLWPFTTAAPASTPADDERNGACGAPAPHLPHHLAEQFAHQLLPACLGPGLRLTNHAARAFVDAHAAELTVRGSGQLTELASALAYGRYPSLRRLRYLQAPSTAAPEHDAADPTSTPGPSAEGAAFEHALPLLAALTSLELRLSPPGAYQSAKLLPRLPRLRRLAFSLVGGDARDGRNMGMFVLAAATQLPALADLSIVGATSPLGLWASLESGVWARLEALGFTPETADDVAALERLPLPNLRHLTIRDGGEALRARAGGGGDAPSLQLLLLSPLAGRLSSFRLPGCRLGGMLLGFGRGLDFACLEDLDLAGCGLGDYSTAELLSARLPGLRRLGLSGNRLTDRGLPALLAPGGVAPRLEALDLSNNKLTCGGLAALAAAPLPALRRLDLSGQRGGGGDDSEAGAAGLLAVAGAAWAPRLEELRLVGAEARAPGDAALAALAASGPAGARAAAEIAAAGAATAAGP